MEIWKAACVVGLAIVNLDVHGFGRTLRKVLESLPKDSKRIFLGTMRFNPQVTRKRLAMKFNNPRLIQVTFHSIRHWRGTMEYHITKDINIENVLFISGGPEEFHVKATHSPDGACKLL